MLLAPETLGALMAGDAERLTVAQPIRTASGHRCPMVGVPASASQGSLATSTMLLRAVSASAFALIP